MQSYAQFSHDLASEVLNTNIWAITGLWAIVMLLNGVLLTALLDHIVGVDLENRHLIAAGLSGLTLSVAVQYNAWMNSQTAAREGPLRAYAALVADAGNSIDALLGLAEFETDAGKAALLEAVERILSTVWYALNLFGGEPLALPGLSPAVLFTNSNFIGGDLAREHRSAIRRSFSAAGFTAEKIMLLNQEMQQFSATVSELRRMESGRIVRKTKISTAQKWIAVYLWIGVAVPTNLWLTLQSAAARPIYPVLGMVMTWEAVVSMAQGNQFSQKHQLEYGNPLRVRYREAERTMKKLKALREQ